MATSFLPQHTLLDIFVKGEGFTRPEEKSKYDHQIFLEDSPDSPEFTNLFSSIKIPQGLPWSSNG